MRLTGYSGRQLPSGMVSTGPCVGPPDFIRSLSLRGCGSGDADASLGGLLVVVGGGLLVVVGGGLLGEGLAVVVGAGDALPLPPIAAATGLSSLAGSSYSVVSQAIPSSGPSSSSSTSGSVGSSLNAACASACERKSPQSRPMVGSSSCA